MGMRELTFTLKLDEDGEMARAARHLGTEAQPVSELKDRFDIYTLDEAMLERLCNRGLARREYRGELSFGYRRGVFWLQAAQQLGWTIEEWE
jgi:hypothetical protein